MKQKIHLFYVGSYLHLIVADGIITMRQLPIDSVYFITYRGVKLPPCYSENLLFDESKTRAFKYVVNNYIGLNKLIRKKEVCAYFPFQDEFPVVKYFDNYVYFEEGLSAYSSAMLYSRCNKKTYFKIIIKDFLLTPFFNKRIRGIINGRKNGSPFTFDCSLLGLSANSYKNVIIDNCNRETIQISGRPLKHSPIKDSVIVIMDSTHATDRMESIDNYLIILSNVLRDIDINNCKVYLKLHPDDYKDRDDAIKIIQKFIDFLEFTVIDESIEDIALSNQNNTFIGTHSTALFYAPIFGKTNRAISYARVYACRDKVYSKWLQYWGGIDGLMDLFENHIECL